jgi:tetratricopeptide (TPR) repeat protein
MRPAARLLAAAFLAAILCSTAVSAAGWEDSYKKGKAACENGDFNQAVKNLRAAIAEKPDEKPNAIKASGMFFEPYLPHFYLGLALAGRKEYTEAVDELNKSESMKVIQKFKDLHAQLRQTRSTAQASVTTADGSTTQPPASAPPAAPPAAPPSTPPSQPSSPAKEPAKDAGPVRVEPPATMPQAPAGPDPLAQAVNAAAVDIAMSQKLEAESGGYLEGTEKRRLDTLVSEIRGAPTPAVVGAKRTELQHAITDLRSKAAERKRQEDVAAGTRKKEQEEQQKRLAQDRLLGDAMAKAGPALREAEAFLGANRAQLQPSEARGLDAALGKVKGASTPYAVNTALPELKTYLADLKKAIADRGARNAADQRQQYARGIEAYFAGRYDEAVPSLQQAAASMPKDADAQAFLGCAYYKKFLLAKGTDATLKQQAEQAFRSALTLQKGYQLDPRYFPPKVVAFFKEVAARS